MKKPISSFRFGILCLFVLFHLSILPFLSVSQVWTPITGLPTADAMKAVHFVSTTTGWASGENGSIMKTINGGNSWTLQNSGTSETLRAIFFADANNGWAAGDNGTIVATTTGGNSWQSQSSGVGTTLTGIEFVNSTTGWIVGLNNTILKTTTGTSWSAQTNQGGAMWGLSMLSTTNGWSAGDFNSVQGSPRLLKTTNGTSWANTYNSGVSSFSGFSDIHFSDANTGWVVGSNGIIRHTTDAGATAWTGQTTGTQFELLSVDFISPTEGYACGRQGVMLHTSDGGANWAAQYSGSSSASIWEVDMIDATTGFAAGDFGIAKYVVSPPAQPIVLHQANGGEIFQISTKRFIIWQAQPSVANVKIEYSVDGGNNWLTVINSTPAATGSYAWNVPNNPSVNCFIRVSNAANASQNDISNAAFYIMNTPTGIDYSVLTEATVSNGPSTITVSWQYDLNALSYSIDRKLPTDPSWTNLATLPATALNYADNSVSNGVSYEYRVTKTTPLITAAYGYVYSGIDIPVVENRGTVLVAVDDAFTSTLSTEIQQLYRNLVGDGWKVIVQSFPSSSTDVTVKNWVVGQYNIPNSNVQALLLVGHFAIPYSGNYAPDGHAERIGAQPADVFYADVNGIWSDNSVVTSNTGTIYNPNTLNDGIWDQSAIPSPVELQVGRIDCYNMTGFTLSETDLIRQYLNKDHNFRHKLNNPERKGLLNPHLDSSLPSTSAVGWRSFSPSLGYSNIDVVNTNGCGSNCNAFIDALENNSYLWTYMAGGGTDTSAGGIVFNSSQCISRTLNTVFMQLYGSYFVEWANGGLPLPNNLLRAPLANDGMTLTTCWTGGGPRWYFQHMGLGETIGFSVKQSQNNTGIYDPGNANNLGGIHMVLMGDPTLRLHTVFPVSNLSVTQVPTGLQLDWNASIDNAIVGYHVYRSDTISGDFVRLNSNPILGTSFIDNNPSQSTNNLYMVRAIKLETEASGSYYNMSTGIFASSFFTVATSMSHNILGQPIFIYPNPVFDALYFSETLYDVEVLDALGRIVLPIAKSAISLDLKSLTNGSYYLRSSDATIRFEVLR